MYPALLRDERFPVKLGPVYGAISPAHLNALLDCTGVIARVRIRTTRAEYPKRQGDEVVYPIGEFVTTLCSPDLLALRKDGEVTRVYQCATYYLGTPFRDAMLALLKARAEADPKTSPDAHALSKLVANSLAGKLAQRVGGWERHSADDCPGLWGEYYKLSGATGRAERFRHLAGAAWRWQEDKLAQGPHTSAFAFLTAYGRQMMRRIRDALPPYTVLQQDTDGLFVLPDAARQLRAGGMRTVAAPGMLREVATEDTAEFFGPKHYRFGRKWTVAGYHNADVDETRREITYDLHAPLFGQKNENAPSRVLVNTLTVGFPHPAQAGRVREDGWIDPPHLLTPWNAREE